MLLQDKICLITGGTKGIGAATAIHFAKQGAHVALAARHWDDEAKQTCAAVEALGRKAIFISADFAKPADATRSVEETVQQLGTIDVLVHAAGGAVNGGLLALTTEAWLGAFDVHVHAIFHLCRAAVPHMQKRPESAIMLISSAAGLRGIKSNIAYQAVKGILPQMTRALAFEFADNNIRVNCVAPGVIRTAFHASMKPEVKKFNLEQRIPLHREGTPEQVAELITTLVTNDFITGETVAIDGGITMRIA